MPSTGDRIREIREHRHMTQEELAGAAGISKGFLSDVENDKRKISSEGLLRIANSLGASIDFLLRGETRETALQDEPIRIPPELSRAAQELRLSYSDTLELLEAHRSVIARRSSEATRQFSADDWKQLYRAIKKVFG
jgi:transcriptional regulator with XRE-family HTH domain